MVGPLYLLGVVRRGDTRSAPSRVFGGVARGIFFNFAVWRVARRDVSGHLAVMRCCIVSTLPAASVAWAVMVPSLAVTEGVSRFVIQSTTPAAWAVMAAGVPLT